MSVLLHASVAGLCLLLMLRVHREDTPQPFIIDAVHALAVPVPSAPANGSHGSLAVNFVPVVRVAPVRPANVIEERADEPALSHTPVRTLAAARPSTPRTTIAEHRRRNPAMAAAAAVPEGRGPASPRINVDEVLAAPGSGPSQPSAGSTAMQTADYWRAFLETLRAAHQKPPGLNDGLQVRVEFLLRADGTLGDVRIVSSSGNAEFDESVIAIFRRVRGLGPPPSHTAGLNQLTFQTREQ
jgi:colicin import membrane protein